MCVDLLAGSIVISLRYIMTTQEMVAFVFVGLFAAFLVGFLIMRPAIRRFLIGRNGIPAKAIVVKITKTNITIREGGDYQIQERPVMELKLQINLPEYVGKYLTTCHAFPYGHMPLAEGDEVKIMIDRKDPSVAILSPDYYTGRGYLL